MANQQFFFFYAPTWDFPPGGPIKLGNVITSVKQPQRPLFCSPPPQDSDVFRTQKKSVQYTKEKLRHGKFSILTKFLSLFGLGGDIGAEIDNRWALTPLLALLGIDGFIPAPPYLQTCIEAPNVRRFLERSRYRKPVYVITGLKVVTGADANTLKSRAVGGTTSVEVDATVWTTGAIPIGGGPGVEGKFANKVGTKWEGASDFMFAFRVSKVRVGKATGQVMGEEEYRKGAMLGDEWEEAKGPELSILAVEEPDAQAEGFDAEELMDDEEVVFCAIPREGDTED